METTERSDRGKETEELLNRLVCLAGLKTLVGSWQDLYKSFGRDQIREKVLADPEVVEAKKKIIAILSN